MKKNLIFLLLLALVFITGCPFDGKTYITAEEQYAIGWILHNVDENTPTTLDYSANDLAVYNYSFNYPSTQPKYFANILFWVPPIHKNAGGGAGASRIRLSAPLDRVYYVKGDNPVPEQYRTDWSFSNYMYLNYIEPEDSLSQFAFDFSHAEHYLSQNTSQAITPIPGDERHIYFGKAPYTPASFIIKDGRIRLNGHLMRGFNNNSYLIRPKKLGASSSDGGVFEVELPTPKYTVYHNGDFKEGKELISANEWNFERFNYFIVEDGDYIVNLTIPTNYPIWNTVIATASFTVPAAELQPPEFQHMEMNPGFIAGEELQIEVDLYDESGISAVGIYVEENNDWVLLQTNEIDTANGIYGSSYTPPSGLNKINVRITATDTIGNTVSYTILPAALPAQNIVFNLKLEENDEDTGQDGEGPATPVTKVKSKTVKAKEENIISVGDTITVNGRCEISGNGFCNTFLIKYYINDEFLESDVSAREVGYINEGDFSLEWQIPFDYPHKDINITTRYSGTGVYQPHEETVNIALESFDVDVGIFDLEISEPIIGEPLNISGIVRNLGLSDVNDVIVKFSVNNQLQEKTSIPEIKVGLLQAVDFEFMPSREEGLTFELEVNAKQDKHSSNDILEEFTRIDFIAPDITFFIERFETVAIDMPKDIEFTMFNYGEETAVNVKAQLYDFFDPRFLYVSFDSEDGSIEEPEEDEVTEESISEKLKSGGGGGGGGATPEPAEPEEPEKKKEVTPRQVLYNGTLYTFLVTRNNSVVTANISTDEFEEILFFTDNDRIKKLPNDISIDLDYSSTFSASFVIGNASLTEKSLGNLEVFEEKKDSIEWTPEQEGEYLLVMFINTSKDSSFRNNYYDMFVKSLGTGINIGAKLLVDYRNEFIVDSESEIDAEIKNLGTEDAENIRVTLYEQKEKDDDDEDDKKEKKELEFITKFKKKLLGTSKIDVLGQGQSKTISFNWTPTKAGESFLLLLAETKHDINAEDNDDIEFVDVLPQGSDIFPRLFYFRKDIFVGDNVTIDGYIRNRGKIDALDVSASLYEVKDDERILIENRNIETVSANSFFDLSFNWTPTSSGETLLEFVTEASNDDNKENNVNQRFIRVLVRDFDGKPTIEFYPEFILVDNSASFGIFVQNFGNKDAPEFNLTLSANGVQADSVIVDGLKPKRGEFVTLSWIPEEEGVFEIEASIDLNDADLSNNFDKDTVKVFKTKDINVTFADKDGNLVSRNFLLGNVEAFADDFTLTVPDAPLDMWIGDSSKEGQIISIYTNSTFGTQLNITSAHIEEPAIQNGLVLYEIFANDDVWDFDSYSSVLDKRLKELNIRYTELKSFVCEDYNFTDDTCNEWEEVESDTLIDRGNLILTVNAPRAQAFAIGDSDYDNDNEPDWDDTDSDNDGISDDQDTFTCFGGRFKSRKAFNVTINESEDIGKEMKGKNKFKVKDKDKKVVEFDINFDTDRLDCREVIIEKQPEITSRGYTLISGVDLDNGTKTAFVDKIANFNRVCIKDEEISSIDEITQNCDGSNEYLIMCDSIKHGNYTCTDTGTQYMVEGLMHSGVTEPTICEESWTCSAWSSCDNSQSRSCTDDNGCGTNFNKPAEQQSCDSGDDDDDSSGSGSRSRGSVFDLGEIKDWNQGNAKSFIMTKSDLLTFEFDNRFNRLVVLTITGTKVTISLSTVSDSIVLIRGESLNFDLDNDGKEDISLTFERTIFNKATILIKRINVDVAARAREERAASADRTVPLSQLPPSQQLEEPRIEAASEEGGSTGLFMTILSFGISMIIISIILSIIYLKRDLIFHKGQEYGHQKSGYDKVEAYALKELNKGFTFKEVSNVLKKAGWPDESINLAMKNIKDRNKKT
ncbi:hypothetical protein CMO94_00620 [Candidatus Woesearchaeota archaeon]|nr:hypothetical protein [Candidatus Woesearchaeota archaeon]